MDRSGGGVALSARLGASCLVWVLACTSPARSGVSADQLLRLAAAEIGSDPSVVVIDAESAQAAWGRVVRARTEAPLEESELLARLFDASADAPVEVVAGGPHAPLNEQVLRDAFSMAVLRDLGAVHLVVVGPEVPSPKVAQLCRDRGAACEAVAWTRPGLAD